MHHRILYAALSVLSAAGAVGAQTVIQLPDSLRAPGDSITWVKRIPTFCEGPAWEPSTGAVYFTRQYGNSTAHWPIYRIRPGTDTGDVFIANAYQANGLAFDPQKRLVAAQNGRITRYTATGAEDTVLVTSGTNGIAFNANNGNQANDLSFGKSGAFYFTALGSQILHVNAQRQLSVAYTGASSANGIEWIEEDSAVYVHENTNIRRYRVNANGSLTDRTTFKTVPGIGADGGTFDSHGNRYVANFSGGDIRVFNAAGDSIGRIIPRLVTGTPYDAFGGNMGNVSNCVFGGPDLKTLYITGDGGLFALRMKIPGRPSPTVPVSLRAASAALKRPVAESAPRDARGRLAPKNGAVPTWGTPLKSAPAK